MLQGTFPDESGDFPAGSYFRNPEGFSHAPFSEEGCIILVKLHQFQPGDSARVCIGTNTEPFRRGIVNLEVLPLHDFEGELVALVRWPAGEVFQLHGTLQQLKPGREPGFFCLLIS